MKRSGAIDRYPLKRMKYSHACSQILYGIDTHRVSNRHLSGYLLLSLPLTRDVVKREKEVMSLRQIGGQLHFDLLVEVGRLIVIRDRRVNFAGELRAR